MTLDKPSNAPYSTNTRRVEAHKSSPAKGIHAQPVHSRNLFVLLLSELR
jgi:hypothetical protein